MIRFVFIFIIAIKISYGFNHENPFFYKIEDKKNDKIPIYITQSLSFGYEDNFHLLLKNNFEFLTFSYLIF